MKKKRLMQATKIDKGWQAEVANPTAIKLLHVDQLNAVAAILFP